MSSVNRGFRAWVEQTGLIDLGFHGPAYTWSNKQGVHSHVAQRLDRALSTTAWSMSYPQMAVFHLPRFQSDHLPILIRTQPKRCQHKQKFRCEDWWALREDFPQVCQKAAPPGTVQWEVVRKNFKKEVK